MISCMLCGLSEGQKEQDVRAETSLFYFKDVVLVNRTSRQLFLAVPKARPSKNYTNPVTAQVSPLSC